MTIRKCFFTLLFFISSAPPKDTTPDPRSIPHLQKPAFIHRAMLFSARDAKDCKKLADVCKDWQDTQENFVQPLYEEKLLNEIEKPDIKEIDSIYWHKYNKLPSHAILTSKMIYHCKKPELGLWVLKYAADPLLPNLLHFIFESDLPLMDEMQHAFLTTTILPSIICFNSKNIVTLSLYKQSKFINDSMLSLDLPNLKYFNNTITRSAKILLPNNTTLDFNTNIFKNHANSNYTHSHVINNLNNKDTIIKVMKDDEFKQAIDDTANYDGRIIISDKEMVVDLRNRYKNETRDFQSIDDKEMVVDLLNRYKKNETRDFSPFTEEYTFLHTIQNTIVPFLSYFKTLILSAFQ